MPITKINDLENTPSVCGSYTLGGVPSNSILCKDGSAALNNEGTIPDGTMIPNYGAIQRIDGSGNIEVYYPTADTNLARGVAFKSAFDDLVANDTLELCGGMTYLVAQELSKTLGNITINGHNSVIKAADALDYDHFMEIICDSNSIVRFNNVIVDGSGSSSDRVAGVGDVFFVRGDGQFRGTECIFKDAKAKSGDAANDGSIVRTEGLGTKIFIGSEFLDPSYSCLRLHAIKNMFLDCDAKVLNYKAGTKARFLYCDSQAAMTDIEYIKWNGGDWESYQAHTKNGNFDPSNAGQYKCRAITLSNMAWNFGTNHVNDGGDSFVKFDDCEYVYVDNIIQRHSALGVVSNGIPEPEPNTHILETVITIDDVTEFHIKNCRMDGSIKGAGTSTKCRLGYIEGCVFGENSKINHAVGNCSLFENLIWENSSAKNIVGIGSGAGSCIFDTAGSSGDQKLILKGKLYFHTNFPLNVGQAGCVTRLVQKVGSFACDDIEISTEGGSMSVIPALTNAQRLMATAYPSNPNVLHLSRNIFKGGSRISTGGATTYSNVQLTPVVAVAPTDDCFPSISTSAPDGARIINDNPDPSGNGHHVEWVKNSTGKFVEI